MIVAEIKSHLILRRKAKRMESQGKRNHTIMRLTKNMKISISMSTIMTMSMNMNMKSILSIKEERVLV